MSIGVEPASSDVEIVDAVDASLGITPQPGGTTTASPSRMWCWAGSTCGSKGRPAPSRLSKRWAAINWKILYKTDVIFDCAYPFAKTERARGADGADQQGPL